MATATTLGPIGINQINNVFYVTDPSEGGFPNIQAAVDYAQKYNAGLGHITIVHGYSGSESIDSVLRGAPNIYITDQRNTAIQNWEWYAGQAKFVPADFFQLANVQIGGLAKAYGFHPLDMTASHVSIGTGGDNTTPALSIINATAPVNQRLWVMAAAPTSLYFSAADDTGQDHTWMQVMRTAAGAASKVIINPPMEVGPLSSQGSPVRTFANSSGGGGGGTGGVNPGTQGQLSFYEVDGPLVSPSLITTDAATQSTLNVPALITSAQANTIYSNFSDRTAANFGYLQEKTTSYTAGAGINVGSPWSGNTHGYDEMWTSQRGITQMRSGTMHKYAVGDTAGLYFYVYTDGGIAAGSDEGTTGISVQTIENSSYFHATINSTSGYGDTAPTYTPTSGQTRTSDGAFMLNISKGQLAGNWNGLSTATYMDTGTGPASTYLNQLPITNLVVTAAAWSSAITYAAGNIVSAGGTNYVSLSFGNANHPPASSPAQWAVLPSGQLPISTAIGIVDASSLPIPYINAPTTQPVSRVLLVNLVKIGGSFPSFAVNDVVSFMGDGYPQQTIITAASAVTGTKQTLTMLLRSPNAQGILFKGGIAGQFISMDANLAFSGMRSSYYACGSQTGTDLIYAHMVGGSVTGNVLPIHGCEAATSSGANSGFHLYPGAEVIANRTLDYDATLEANGVRWQPGDAVENPHYPAFGGAGIGLSKTQVSPTPASSGTTGINLWIYGSGFCGTAIALSIRAFNPSNYFWADSGPVAAPGGIELSGYFNYGLKMTAPQQGLATAACLFVTDPAAPSNPNAAFKVVSIGYSTSGDLSFDPTPTGAPNAAGTWSFGGHLKTPANFAAGGSITGGYTLSADQGLYLLKGRVSITQPNPPYGTSVSFIFSPDDGSGIATPNTQSIIAVFNYPSDFNMYYNTFSDAGHIFRTASYGGSPDILATINRNGITATGPVSAASYNVGGTAGANGSFTTADTKTVTVTHGLITAIV